MRKFWGWLLLLLAVVPIRIVQLSYINYPRDWTPSDLIYYSFSLACVFGWYWLAIRKFGRRSSKCQKVN